MWVAPDEAEPESRETGKPRTLMATESIGKYFPVRSGWFGRGGRYLRAVAGRRREHLPERIPELGAPRTLPGQHVRRGVDRLIRRRVGHKALGALRHAARQS